MSPVNHKTVSFGEISTTLFHEVSVVEVNELWYSQDDFKVMKEDQCLEMKHRQQCEEERRLELCCDDHGCFSDSKARRQNHVASIMALQDEHQANGIQDSKGLQMMSATLSKSDTRAAQERALRDSMDAFQLHYNHNETVVYLKAKNAEEYSRKVRMTNRKHLVRPTRRV